MPAEEGTMRRWTVAELRRMPAHERDAIFAEAAELAEADYRNDKALTAFEAFGEADLFPTVRKASPWATGRQVAEAAPTAETLMEPLRRPDRL